MKPIVLFDLDGTLTDPKDGITRAIQYAQQKLGAHVDTMEDLLSFIGPPLAVSFRECGYDDEKVEQAITYYREYFTAQGMFENEVYAGIEQLLQQLKKQHITLAIATSKPEVFAKKIVAYFQLADYFEVVVGSELDGTRTLKADVIAEVLARLQVAPSECVMIGDRKHDMIGAAAHHMACVGVTYGYGSAEELQAAGAQHICDSVAALQHCLVGDLNVSEV